ncbi:hypothetical protein [Thalassobaculum sp.]|uniref:hypothetical protein n=1 Tax=Thalassobaculum sp. TaxID=2022740 RepID=UPI0032EEFC6B
MPDASAPRSRQPLPPAEPPARNSRRARILGPAAGLPAETAPPTPADARAIRIAAERMQSLVAQLIGHAETIEGSARARHAARERSAKRAAALDAMRAAMNAGRPAFRAAQALAGHYGLDPHALADMAGRDRRRSNRAERAERDATILRLALQGLTNARIAERMTLAGTRISARRVGEIVRAQLIERIRNR